MLITLIAVGAGLVAFSLGASLFGPVAGFLPGFLVFGLVWILLSRRVAQEVEVALRPLPALAQERKVEEARQLLQQARRRFGRWQLLLDGQLAAQIGMLDYALGQHDQALPNLERGKWRNWAALTAIGCIHWRKGNKPKAWESLQAAAAVAGREVIVYGLLARLKALDGDVNGALAALDMGLRAAPDSAFLKEAQRRLANGQSLEVRTFPPTWFQFFPEDLVTEQELRARAAPAGQARRPGPGVGPLRGR
jgi:tetratricopeptide (TPR) repeat protein